MTAAQGEILLLQITDTHLHATTDSKMRGVNTYTTLRRVLEHVRNGSRWPPVAIIATGDLVQDESRAGYERFAELLKTLATPTYCIPGNHDDPELMAQTLGPPAFQVCGSARLGSWCLVMLNTFEAGEDAGRLAESELERLDQTLAEHSECHALVCLHHQPIRMGSAWLDGVGLRNADDFLDVIDRHTNVRGVVWGHVHQASDNTRNGVRYLSTPSTCSQFLPMSAHFAIDQKPPGCRWLRLGHDGSIATTVDWID